MHVCFNNSFFIAAHNNEDEGVSLLRDSYYSLLRGVNKLFSYRYNGDCNAKLLLDKI